MRFLRKVKKSSKSKGNYVITFLEDLDNFDMNFKQIKRNLIDVLRMSFVTNLLLLLLRNGKRLMYMHLRTFSGMQGTYRVLLDLNIQLP